MYRRNIKYKLLYVDGLHFISMSELVLTLSPNSEKSKSDRDARLVNVVTSAMTQNILREYGIIYKKRSGDTECHLDK